MTNIPTRLEIFTFRGQQVLLSSTLAVLYGVAPKVLLQAVKRNIERFPEDFMFQVNSEEWQNLKSQNVTSSWGGVRTPPYAFTEQGVAMLSSVLKSERAIKVNIEIMRAFVRLRKLASEHQELSHRIDALELRYDEQFSAIFDAIRQLMVPQQPQTRPIGFTADLSGKKEKK